VPHGQGELILVVDDEADIGSVAAAILIKHGYRAITCQDGRRGPSFCLRNGSAEIRAVITDINIAQPSTPRTCSRSPPSAARPEDPCHDRSWLVAVHPTRTGAGGPVFATTISKTFHGRYPPRRPCIGSYTATRPVESVL